MASAAGHDLLIEVERWSATLDLNASDPQLSKLAGSIDATSLAVREGTGGVKALTDSDRAEIEGNINGKILKTDRNPEITFESTAIHSQDARFWRIEGQLTIAGTTSPVELEVSVKTGDGGTVLKASAPIVQSSFGIKPYSAMMGALKVADSVEIQAQARIPASVLGPS